MESKIFYCYSKPLKDFLIDSGQKYFTKGIHDKTKKKFWMFHGSDELNKLLEQWKLRRG